MKALVKVILVATTIKLLLSCSNKIIYSSSFDCRPLSEDRTKNALKVYKAEDNTYSLIIFTNVFDNEHVIVFNNGKEIFKDNLTSDKSMGLSKVIRIDNTENVKISFTEDNTSILLDEKKLKNHKYIYIEKVLDKRSFTVNFSKKLCSFK